MATSVATSPLLAHRAEAVVERRLAGDRQPRDVEERLDLRLVGAVEDRRRELLALRPWLLVQLRRRLFDEADAEDEAT